MARKPRKPGGAESAPDTPSGALVVSKPSNGASSKPEKLPPPEDIELPAALLLSAEAVSGSSDSMPVLAGVYVHTYEGVGRVVGTDGARAFISSFKLPEQRPAWLETGIILSREGLRARVAMIAKGREAATVRVSFAQGQAKATLTDSGQNMAFRVDVVAGDYPEYWRFIPPESFGSLDPEGRPQGHEWEPVGINSVYLKHVGDLARTLEAGLPKDQRSKQGMVVRAFNGGTSTDVRPLIFDFSNWPGAVMVVMTAKLANPGISAETAALLAPQLKLTLAALRAHATRWLVRAEEASDEQQKAHAQGRATEFQERIAEILKRAPGLPAIAGGEAAPEPDETGEAELAGEAASPDPTAHAEATQDTVH